jgi:hypothetical protein
MVGIIGPEARHPRRRPTWSRATATWRSLWVSTPSVTEHALAICVLPVRLPGCDRRSASDRTLNVQVNAPIGSRRRAAITARDAASRSTDQRIGTAKGHSKLESDPRRRPRPSCRRRSRALLAGHSNDGPDPRDDVPHRRSWTECRTVTAGTDRGHRPRLGQPLGVADRQVLGGFNWSSQHCLLLTGSTVAR